MQNIIHLFAILLGGPMAAIHPVWGYWSLSTTFQSKQTIKSQELPGWLCGLFVNIRYIVARAIAAEPPQRWTSQQSTSRVPAFRKKQTVPWSRNSARESTLICTITKTKRWSYMTPNRVNRAHWPTKENRHSWNIFVVFSVHGQKCLGWARMGPGGWFST